MMLSVFRKSQDAAGVTKPTLYHYFGSKYGLLQAVAMEGYADLQTGMAEAIQYQGDLQLNLERMSNFILILQQS